MDLAQRHLQFHWWRGHGLLLPIPSLGRGIDPFTIIVSETLAIHPKCPYLLLHTPSRPQK
jgi:hypothetical protein